VSATFPCKPKSICPPEAQDFWVTAAMGAMLVWSVSIQIHHMMCCGRSRPAGAIASVLRHPGLDRRHRPLGMLAMVEVAIGEDDRAVGGDDEGGAIGWGKDRQFHNIGRDERDRRRGDGEFLAAIPPWDKATMQVCFNRSTSQR